MLLTKLANQEIVNFLRTVTIKNRYFADQLKATLVNEQYRNLITDENNPYYLHLTGQYILPQDVSAVVSDPATGVKTTVTYKSSFLNTDPTTGKTSRLRNLKVYTEDAWDEMMYVTSLDTQEKIPFTRELLHGDPLNPNAPVHKKTLSAYKIPGRYFDMLCDTYPKQVDLIKSIVYLVPPKELSEVEKSLYGDLLPDENTLRMQNVIEADHLKMINYDASLLEERERQNMLDTINATLDLIRIRWDVKEYTYEENYANVHWAMLWSLLPLVLVSQRYANIRGPQVHSSHIWDYLTSNGLDSYRGYLTGDQEWFLYKNIKFLKENGGQNRILNILIDNLLADYSLHIESKTVVMDKTNVLKTDEIGNSVSDQCSRCSRQKYCFKNITSYACSEFVGRKNLYKPEPVILSEELPGARKERIISALMTQYDCTNSEAESRYERSFMWRDEIIEKIKDELDRDQTVNMNGVTESLSEIIRRENEAGLEPEYSDSIVEDQRHDLRHVRSTYLPTKLLEITEDASEPYYNEMFTKFVTDTMLHLAPTVVNGEIVNRIVESYAITVGQDAVTFILNYGELIAALYLGFMKETGAEIYVDRKNSNSKWATSVHSDFIEFPSFDFKIPTASRIGMAFKLAKPIKQQVLVDACEEDDDTSLLKLGNYVPVTVTNTSVPNPYVEYYVDGANGKVKVLNLTKFESDVDYYTFSTLMDLTTNKSVNASTNAVLSRLVKIDGVIYAIDSRATTSDDGMWYNYGYSTTYIILGRFSEKNGIYTYTENNGEIGIIPRYFRWHYNHLDIRVFRTIEELTSRFKDPVVGDVAAIWSPSPVVKIYDTTGWRTITRADAENTKIRQIAFIYDPPSNSSQNELPYTNPAGTVTRTTTTTVTSLNSYSQNRVKILLKNNGEIDSFFVTDAYPMNGSYTSFKVEDEFTSYTGFYDYISELNENTSYACELENYVNVDWILKNLYVDFYRKVTTQDEIGEYFDKMFTIYSRLDLIRSSCGDIRTKLAIKTFMEAVLVDKKNIEITNPTGNKTYDSKRNEYNFQLVQVGSNQNPTYEDWFQYNTEIGDAFRKLQSSDNAELLWSEFNAKLCEALLSGCGSVYAGVGTDQEKYLKLKELVKSLSSYLINFIDTNVSSRVSTEIPHIAQDIPAHEIEFTSYIDFDPVGQVEDKVSIGNVEGDLYFPTQDQYALEGETYYMQDHSLYVDEVAFIASAKTDEYSSLNQTWTTKPTEIGDDLSDHPRYKKVNLKSLLNLPEDARLKVWTDGDLSVWNYAVGYDVTIPGKYISYCGKVDTYASLPNEDRQVGDWYTVEDTNTNYIWFSVNGSRQWVDIGKWDGYLETFENDPGVMKVANATLTDQVLKMVDGYDISSNLGARIYKKYDTRVFTAWGESKSNDKLSIYMREMAKTTHSNLTSLFRTSVPGYTAVKEDFPL